MGWADRISRERRKFNPGQQIAHVLDYWLAVNTGRHPLPHKHDFSKHSSLISRYPITVPTKQK